MKFERIKVPMISVVVALLTKLLSDYLGLSLVNNDPSVGFTVFVTIIAVGAIAGYGMNYLFQLFEPIE